MHHCIADGIALARVMLSLTDSDSDVGIASPLPEPPRPPSARLLPGLTGSTERFLAGAGHAGAAAVRHGADLLTSPSHAASLAGAIARDGAAAARLLLTPADTASPIKGDPGLSRRVAWASRSR